MLNRKLRERVIRFFADNPDEELTIADVAVKFGVHAWEIPVALARALVTKQLLRIDDTYRAGPALATQARSGETAAC